MAVFKHFELIIELEGTLKKLQEAEEKYRASKTKLTSAV